MAPKAGAIYYGFSIRVVLGSEDNGGYEVILVADSASFMDQGITLMAILGLVWALFAIFCPIDPDGP